MPAFDVVDTIPITTDSDGIIRVSGTRVTLDTIVAAFQDGATPEEIARQYPSVPLGDIYQVVGYYLRHSEELDRYLEQRKQLSTAIRAENEQRWDPAGVKDRLVARQAK